MIIIIFDVLRYSFLHRKHIVSKADECSINRTKQFNLVPMDKVIQERLLRSKFENDYRRCIRRTGLSDCGGCRG